MKFFQELAAEADSDLRSKAIALAYSEERIFFAK